MNIRTIEKILKNVVSEWTVLRDEKPSVTKKRNVFPNNPDLVVSKIIIKDFGGKDDVYFYVWKNEDGYTIQLDGSAMMFCEWDYATKQVLDGAFRKAHIQHEWQDCETINISNKYN